MGDELRAQFGRDRGVTVFSRTAEGSPQACASHLFRWEDHLLAILVHQGSDPTPPYQTWVIRKSATLFRDFASWDS